MNKPPPLTSTSTTIHRITFEPVGISCRVPAEITIMEIAADLQIELRSDCGGKGRCGQCRVVVDPVENLSPPSARESELLTPREIDSGIRLACEARIRGPLRVKVPDTAVKSHEAGGKAQIRGSFSRNPLVRRATLSLNSAIPSEEEGPSDLAGVVRARAGEHFVADAAIDDPEVLRALSRLKSGHGDITLVRHAVKGTTAVLTGCRTRSLGIALDIGTTTLAAYLCDFGSGGVLSSFAAANPQRRFGEDVITRISFAGRDESGLSRLQKAVVGEINSLMGQCVRAAGADLQDIDEVTVVGNTTMQQIFMGFDPQALGVSPYQPVSCGPHDFRAKDLGLDLNPAVNVHIFPVLSGFVGGDTAGAILAERPHEKDETTLIVDIGTNGELVLGNRRGLWATSCATGPALEGAHIHCGMRASEGAIAKVRIDPVDFKADYEVIGGKSAPRGICGSGIIDAAAGMLQAGLILSSGRIREGLPGVTADEKGIGRRFRLVGSQESATGEEIFISLDDIRQVQLAKSALSAGIHFLMRRAGVVGFDRLVLTGAFGARFDWKNAVAIGMLPEAAYLARVDIVPNAAGKGAVMALLDGRLRQEIRRVAAKVCILELAQEPDFAEQFAERTLFPAIERR